MNTVYLLGDPTFGNRLEGGEKLAKLIENKATSSGWEVIRHVDWNTIAELESPEGYTGLICFTERPILKDLRKVSDQFSQLSWVLCLYPVTAEMDEHDWDSAISLEQIPMQERNWEGSLSYLNHRLNRYFKPAEHQPPNPGEAILTAMPRAVQPLIRDIDRKLQQLEDRQLGQEVSATLDETQQRVIQIEELMDELELLRNLHRGEVLAPERFELKNVFDRLRQHLESRLNESKQLQLNLTLQEDLPPALLGYQGLLHRILYQLLLNSVEHTQQGQIDCVAELISLPDDELTHAWIRFEVSDSGEGIDAATLKRITNGRLFEGGPGKLGAGLMLVQYMVHQLGGTFEIDSAPRQGTKVTLQLPFDLSDEPVAGEREEQDDLPDLASARILIVEDNPVNMSVIEQVVSETHASISKSENGQEALEYLKDYPQDLILMDVQMPVMDGIEATRRIQEEYENWHPERPIPKIVALTAAALDGDREKCLEAGMVDYITKPFRAEEVYEVLEKYVTMEEGISFEATASSLSEKAPSPAGSNTATPFEDAHMVSSVQRLYEYAQHNETLVANMIDVFLKHTPEYINLLRKLIEEDQWPKVKKQAHKMKPQMGYVGLDRVVIMLERIEEEALSRQRSDQAIALLRKVEQLCDRAMEELALWKEYHEAKTE
jgi:CheY-like chemotaxis protein/signal transduction histidine kinase/HPt (histidine-containing phosphotransfer) domain-containing protein